MKSSKQTRQQYGNAEQRKRSEKSYKLDRKSSRGMVYENEELRLRTININAEVERGQSDIKRLRKENDHLRREIWSLRDEYDRLNKRFKTKFIEAEQAARCSQAGCSCQCAEGACDIGHSKCNSEDSDSCDSCCCQENEEIVCNDECCSEKKIMASNADAANDPSPADSTKLTVIDGVPVTAPQPAMPSILTGIDHLSVVSEETLSNSDVANVNPGQLLAYTPSISGSQTTLPSLVGPLTPLTPIELVANELNDIQAKVPPLSYFENVLQQHMHSNLTSSSGTSSSKSGRTVIRHTNGWDYNLESPFIQKHYPVNSVSPLLQKRTTAQTLTTFVPTTTLTPPPPAATTDKNGGKSVISTTTVNSTGEVPVIETVPITTMSVNGPCAVQSLAANSIVTSSGKNNSNSNQNITTTTTSNSINGNEKPKHFFAPIKPKLKLNTALANQRRQPPPPPPPAVVTAAPIPASVPVHLNKAPSFTTNGVLGASNTSTTTTTTSIHQLQKCEPPDIYVTNGLATPYKQPLKSSVQPPPVPQRITSMATPAQVSLSPPRQRRKSRQCQSNLQEQHQHHHHYHQHSHQSHQHIPQYQHQFHGWHNHEANANNEDCVAGLGLTTNPTINNSTNISDANATTTTSTFCFFAPASLRTTLTNALLATNILCNSLKVTITATSQPPPAPPITPNLLPSYSNCLTAATTTTTPLTTEPVTCLPAALASFRFINPNITVIKPNGPVYAIAQNVCHNLIIAPAVRQPLMSSIVKCCPSTITTPKKLLMSPTATTTRTPTSSALESLVAMATVKSTTTTTKTETPNPACIVVPPSVSCCASVNAFSKSTDSTRITTSVNCFVVDSVCQTDSANLESILNDIEAISEDILAIQLEKTRSRDNLETRSTENVSRTTRAEVQQGNKNAKPYRSEMNLLLSYDGDNPTIRQAMPKSSSNATENASENTGTSRRTRSLEREHTDSPSPRIPDPMQPFPENRKYVGFERLNNAAIAGTTAVVTSTATVTTSIGPRLAVTGTQTSPTIATPMGHRSHLPLSPLVTNVNMPMQQNIAGKPNPPARQYPPPLNIKCAGIQRSSSVSYKSNAMHSPTTGSGSPILSGVHPNKSQLYSAIANAAVARRAQFRSQPTHMTRSLDTDCLLESPNEACGDMISKAEEKEIAEATKRKARRVSIVCADSAAATVDSPSTPGEKSTPTTVRTIHTQNSSTTSTSGSCSDLPTVMPNPALRNFKQTSHSTPNSPHSSRKHEGSPFSTQPPTISITPTSPLQHQHSRSSSTHGNGSPHHHQHSHSNSYPNAVATIHHQQLRKNSQDTIKASAAEIACAAANVVRSKCSRRHSEGTVSHTNQRSSGVSGGTNGGHHHGHHNHHHHQHSSSIVSNTNPHHSRHSHQDSNHETVASCSDRNSNSLASSRESSASFSMRSTRRKLSVSSNTGGKIPWCGCWGNGCL
ncbi:uncharacterized protein isoform X2 [Musca autumnalis]|uniref:uncharacterized protein isoform X2 n=1 Tax=Musca autumnalis TaxID=221902 RepID=UPI003CEEF7D1